MILDENGMPTKDAYKQYLGHLDPNFRMGMQNTFRYKDFTLSVDLDGAYKGVIYSVLSEKLWWGGKHPESVEYRDAQYAVGHPIYVPNGVVVTGGELKRDIDGNVISDTRTYKRNTTAVDWQQWCQNYPYQVWQQPSCLEKSPLCRSGLHRRQQRRRCQRSNRTLYRHGRQHKILNE